MTWNTRQTSTNRRTGYGELFRSEVEDVFVQISKAPTMLPIYKGGPTVDVSSGDFPMQSTSSNERWTYL